jgi:DNA mismatch repair protein MutS2
MDEKTFSVLEYPRILECLSTYASFSVSAALVRSLRPTNDLDLALERLARTTEARRLLIEHPQTSIGDAHDISSQLNLAERGGVLSAEELMDIKGTLSSARDLARIFERVSGTFPRLSAIAAALPPPSGLIEAISRVFSDNGEVLDSASEKLASLRRELKIAYDRLISKLERMINDPHTAALLQEPIFTTRNGRYVLPLRAENKSKLKGLTQDQSSSGSTLFIEPLAIVELNNHWHELQLSEQEEVRRILAELSAQVGAHTPQLQAMLRSLSALDLAFACAKYAEDLHASEPLLMPYPSDEKAGCVLHLINARHPLLDPASVVPIEAALEKGTHALVITGPNTGGKTVTLKTVGLLALMAQSGLHIPAQSGSQLSLFRDVFADIGDEQSIEQSLSTFSSHITNIVRILKHLNRGTLVLLDELGAGTDPQEGSALARAILSYLLAHKTPCLIATHYPELKAFAHSTSGAMNASMEFDLKSLKPTYHLIMGLPGRSNALAIAQRLGLSEEIIQDARQLIDPADLHAEDLLDEIHRQRDAARHDRSLAEADLVEAEDLRTELEERLEKIEQERQLILEKARQEAEKELELIRQELEETRLKMRGMRNATESIKSIKEKIEQLHEKTSKPVERLQPAGFVTQEPRPLRLGDRVHLFSLKVDGEVTGLSGDEVEVLVGKMRIKVSPGELQRSRFIPELPAKNIQESPATKLPNAGLIPSPGVEVHLRGMRAEAAVEKLERYLDDAYAAGLPYVRVVHGKGTGTLRQVVRQMLGSSPLVKNWEIALDNEGGEGVTIAHLVTE